MNEQKRPALKFNYKGSSIELYRSCQTTFFLKKYHTVGDHRSDTPQGPGGSYRGMKAAPIRVLYVDDEPDLLEIGKMFLEISGDFEVITVTMAPDAIRLLEQEKFDAIISDYHMP